MNRCECIKKKTQNFRHLVANIRFYESVPVVDDLQNCVHFNPLLEDAMIERLTTNHRRIVSHIPAGDEAPYLYVTEGEQTEWWRCHKHFQVKDAIVHLLN